MPDELLRAMGQFQGNLMAAPNSLKTFLQAVVDSFAVHSFQEENALEILLNSLEAQATGIEVSV